MSVQKSILHSIDRKCALAEPVTDGTPTQPALEPLHYCAYNKTRERLFAIDVELVDPSQADLYDRLATLEPKSAMALWIDPFLTISPEYIYLPIDLVYLDRNYIVTCTVESFPQTQPIGSRSGTYSVLALPERTIASTGTTAGDQLIFCSPEKLTRRLRSMQPSEANAQDEENSQVGSSSKCDSSSTGRKPSGQVIKWEDHSPETRASQNAAIPVNPAESSSPEVSEPPAAMSETGKDVAKVTKNWLQRWLAIEPSDPRYSPREALPWIIAYFFNGAAPTPCEICNISRDGMYILTNERWYLGTIVRMTLTDRRQPIADRSITVNAMVVRWGDNGVGIEFVFEKEKKRRRGVPPPPPVDSPLVQVTRKEFIKFIEVLKGDLTKID